MHSCRTKPKNCCRGLELSNLQIRILVEQLFKEHMLGYDSDMSGMKEDINQLTSDLVCVNQELNRFIASLANTLDEYSTLEYTQFIEQNLRNLIEAQDLAINEFETAIINQLETNSTELASALAGLRHDTSNLVHELRQEMADLEPTRDAYKVAVDGGFVGSESEWLDSLKGKSAYELAKAHGFSGSEAEWVTTIKGPKGEKGDDGQVIINQNGNQPLKLWVGTQAEYDDVAKQNDTIYMLSDSGLTQNWPDLEFGGSYIPYYEGGG